MVVGSPQMRSSRLATFLCTKTKTKSATCTNDDSQHSRTFSACSALGRGYRFCGILLSGITGRAVGSSSRLIAITFEYRRRFLSTLVRGSFRFVVFLRSPTPQQKPDRTQRLHCMHMNDPLW
jgi:hypothetical protein